MWVLTKLIHLNIRHLSKFVYGSEDFKENIHPCKTGKKEMHHVPQVNWVLLLGPGHDQYPEFIY